MSTRAASASRRLAALRRRVDAVDRRIVRLLAARQRLVAAMPPFKTRLRDPGREADILRQAARQAGRSRLDRAFVREVYRALLGASRSFLRRGAGAD
ncbi:MAG: chorismate mutase [Elusimicrobia bacterium]|nr:chorismate mutase [Elusimicrobiota bacterium]